MGVKTLMKSKWKDIILLILLAIALAFAIWQVFGKEGAKQTVNMQNVRSEEEIKLTELLSQIQGVGEVDVMISQTENGEKSVVVVCDGAKDIQVNMDVREAVATALGTTEQSIKIYLKKD